MLRSNFPELRLAYNDSKCLLISGNFQPNTHFLQHGVFRRGAGRFWAGQVNRVAILAVIVFVVILVVVVVRCNRCHRCRRYRRRRCRYHRCLCRRRLRYCSGHRGSCSSR
ncbi:unnamed protein product [Dracunculus medinensis]|uniref:Uncharacterized protein n=1 Tax=Dracunculus medinensis TaxID=318479 RepID=A0A0N4UCU5_DRAME|nr:unnamed protein product [Dracunculus medinensis]